jgi:GxxExxY protein
MKNADSELSNRDPRTYQIIGAAMEVHRELWPGFLEAVYQEVMGIELRRREVPFKQEVVLDMFYKGETLMKKYVADFVCYRSIIVETKSQKSLTQVDTAQTINYLKATRHPLGLLINFGLPSLQTKRLTQSASASAPSA